MRHLIGKIVSCYLRPSPLVNGLHLRSGCTVSRLKNSAVGGKGRRRPVKWGKTEKRGGEGAPQGSHILQEE